MNRKDKHPEYQYLNLIKDILKNGSDTKEFNTSIKLRGVFGRQMRFDLSEGFPLLTTKKVFVRGIIHELLWFLRGDSNIKYLVDNDVHIWDEWVYKRFREAQSKNMQSMRSGEREKLKTQKGKKSTFKYYHLNGSPEQFVCLWCPSERF